MRFWKAYPKKAAKPDAEKAWRQVKPTDEQVDAMLSALDTLRCGDQWTRDGGKFIPYPATWLRQKRWEDEAAESTGPKDGTRGVTDDGRQFVWSKGKQVIV